MSHRLRFFAPFPVLLITALGPLQAQPPTPHIAWSQLTTEITLIQNATAAKTVAFISDQPLQNISILADSALAPYLTVAPTLIPSVPAGREQHVTITAAGAPPLGDLTGTVRIHSGHDSFRAFLNVTLHVMQPRIPELVFSETQHTPTKVALATSSSGVPHIALQVDFRPLYFYKRGPLGWAEPEFIGDFPGNATLSLAVDSSGFSHVAIPLSRAGALMYAGNSRGSWTIEAAAPSATYAAIAVTPTGQPCIAYDSFDVSLTYGCRTPAGWTQQVIDPRGSFDYPWQEDPSLSIDSAGNAHVIYYREASQVLFYATNASGVWVPEPIFSQPTVSNNLPKELAIDSYGVVHVAYCANGANLIYARRSSSGWIRERVTDCRVNAKIGVDPSGVPYIVSTKGDQDLKKLVVSNRRTGAWISEMIDFAPGQSFVNADMAVSSSAIHIVAGFDTYPAPLTFNAGYVSWLLGH